MSTDTATQPILDLPAWDEPVGATPRGTVIVLPGRGEGVAEYQRFGRRISSENWKVRLVPLDPTATDDTRDRLRQVLADESLPAPRVLIGADAAATWVSREADTLGVDGAIVAGAAVSGSASVTGWDEEIEARSACPVHRAVLGSDPHFRRGALDEPLPTGWTPGAPGVPTLVLHGDADPVTPLSLAVDGYDHPATRVKVVHGGRHDVLNDASHRAVAATIVLFLESLRLGTHLPEIVTDAATGGQA